MGSVNSRWGVPFHRVDAACSHSTFTHTVNERVGRFPSDQDSAMANAHSRALHDSCGRDIAWQSAREEILPGKRYVLIGPASV
eukprot:4807638-Prymnesium_polylepis.1